MSAGVSNYNFPDHIKGDTFNGKTFTVTLNAVALNLTSAIINMDMRLTPTGTVVKSFTSVGSGGITINANPVLGKFTLDAQLIDIAVGEYWYDIEIELSSGVVKTYIGGRWTILQDITYE